MTYQVCNESNTRGATSEAETANHFGTSEFAPVFSDVRVAQSLVFCVVFVDHCLFVCSHLVIVLYVLRFTDSYYSLGIFKLFMLMRNCIHFEIHQQ